MIEKDAQLIRAGKMNSLAEFSARIAHELKQPLNAIKMGSEYLALVVERNLDVPKHLIYQAVSEISAQVDRAVEIIDMLRSFGRKSDRARESIDINRPIRSACRTLAPRFEQQNIRVVLALAEGLPAIMAHDDRLQLVFSHLLANAGEAIRCRKARDGEQRHTPDAIGIRSSCRGDRVMAEVRDTGIGIPEEYRERIFEPFFTTKQAGRGMGLGLAISCGIVEDFGGEIRIDSPPGRGAAFKLSFPAAGGVQDDRSRCQKC